MEIISYIITATVLLLPDVNTEKPCLHAWNGEKMGDVLTHCRL